MRSHTWSNATSISCMALSKTRLSCCSLPRLSFFWISLSNTMLSVCTTQVRRDSASKKYTTRSTHRLDDFPLFLQLFNLSGRLNFELLHVLDLCVYVDKTLLRCRIANTFARDLVSLTCGNLGQRVSEDACHGTNYWPGELLEDFL